METKIWLKKTFSIKSIPNWTCPSCNKGQLALVQDQFHFEETKESEGWHSEDGWEPDSIQYRFHGTLRCLNCKDFVSFLGKGSLDYFQIDEFEYEYYEAFYPLFFNPPLSIFKINDSCPEDVSNKIVESFNLFWNDLHSCANSIRTSLEMLMNHQKVKRFRVQKSKRYKLSLHERIGEFKKSKPEIAEYLLAIKWIGNAGSHIGKLEKIDILETYGLLEHTLNKLLDNTEEKLLKITKEINKRKGTRKRKN